MAACRRIKLVLNYMETVDEEAPQLYSYPSTSLNFRLTSIPW